MTESLEIDSFWDYLINKKIPTLPIVIKLNESYIRWRIRKSIPFSIVFFIAICSALKNFYEMNNITISNSFDILMTIISVIIFSAIMLEIYRCFRLLYDTTWLEINSDGINYRTGFFYTKKTLKWAHVKIFKGRRGAVVYLPFERHTAGNIYQVYFILNKAFKEEYRKNIRGAENYDGHIKVHLGFDFLDTNKFIDNVDQKFTKIITENGRHPPFARFLNDVKKLCTDHPNGIVDVERT